MNRRHLLTWLLPSVLACNDMSGTYKTTSTSLSDAKREVAASAATPDAITYRATDLSATQKLGDVQTLPDTTSGASSQGGTVIPTMVIRSGQTSIEVASVDTAMAQVQTLARQLGGYVANSTIEGGKYTVRSATLEVKIPAAKFDAMIAGLRPIGTVETVNIAAQDVGEEFVDVTARMTNARRLEQRLVELLANRTGKLEDVLAVERELARVREEIERYEGRLRYLRTRAAVSTIIVTVHESAPLLKTSVGENPISEAFKNAWRNFVQFTAGFIASLGVLIPLLVLAMVVWGIIRWLRRRMPPKAPKSTPMPRTPDVSSQRSEPDK